MKRSKALLTLLCAAALVVTSVFGTMAYLTDKDTVTNTFTVGNVEINLDETKVDENGDPVKPAERTETGNQYHLLPGHEYVKDPTVTVLEDSEDSYVRILMKINKQDELDAIFKKINEDRAAQQPALEPISIADVLTGWNQEWVLFKETENGDNTRTYEFRYNTIVNDKSGENKDGVLKPLFTNIKMPGEITNDQLKTLYIKGAEDNLAIDIVAQAIQADGFENNVNAAWTAFGNQK